MRSRRISRPVPAVCEGALDPRDPLGELVEVIAERRDSRVLPRLVAARAGCRVVGDEHSAAWVGLHELFLAEHVECVADGHRGDAVAAGQVPAGGEAIPRLERPASDARPQVVSHLHVCRPRIIRVRLHLSRVRRSRYLGRTPDLTEGLRFREHRSRVLYIALVQLARRPNGSSRSIPGGVRGGVPRGAYAAGGVEMFRDFEQSRGDRVVQQADKATGCRCG